jgi:TetR/AcrR family transcriptional regulator, mexCD-oprJ operon repressor
VSNSAPRPALRQHVATAIVEAAAGALAEQGEQASMSDVASAAGVARATVYRHFESREVLLQAVGRFALDDAGERLGAARLDEVAPADGLKRAVRALVGAGAGFVVLARERARPDGTSLGERIGDFEERIGAPLRDLIARGQDAGVIRGDVPAAWLAEALFGIVVNATASTRALGTDDIIAATSSVFLDGARGEGHPR